MGRGKELDWCPVWDKLVRLYSNPKLTLTHVMAILKQQDGFVASRRAYWSKLRKEGVTRIDHCNAKERHTNHHGTTLENEPGMRQVRRAGSQCQVLPGTDDTSSWTACYPLSLPYSSDTQEFHASCPSEGSRSTQYRLKLQGTPAHASANLVALHDDITQTIGLDGRSGASHAAALLMQEKATFNAGEESILHYCVRTGSPILDHVLAFMRTWQLSFDFRDQTRYTALELAVQHGLYDVSERLLRAGASVHTEDEYGRRPLDLAVRANDYIAVQKLLHAGALVNTQDGLGEGPLHAAVEPLTPGLIVEMLLDAGADVCRPNDAGVSPLALLVSRLRTMGWTTDALQCSELLRNTLLYLNRMLLRADEDQLRLDENLFPAFLNVMANPAGKSSKLLLTQCAAAFRYCVETFLAKGCSPLTGINCSGCPDGMCSTFADYAAFHDDSDSLWSSIIGHSDMSRYREQLIVRVLRLCEHARHRSGLSEKLLALCRAGVGFSNPDDAVAVLHNTLGAIDGRNGYCKSASLAALFNSNVAEHIHTPCLGVRPLQTLITATHFIKDWDTANVLLSVDAGFQDEYTESAGPQDVLFIHPPGSAYLRYLDISYRGYLRCYFACGNSGAIEPARFDLIVREAHRYVLDTLTKRMIADELPEPRKGTRSSRLIDALCIKR